MFDSEYSPLNKFPRNQIQGFTNASTKESLSFFDIRDNSIALSTCLVNDYGLKPGQVVSLFSMNNVWYPIAMHATARVGGIVSGASPAYNVEEMSYALKTASAKFLFTVPASIEIAAQAAKNAGIPQTNVFLLEGTMHGFTTIQQLIERGKTQTPVSQYTIPTGKTNHDICGFLSFSSGTTGLPKAVMISHQNIIAQCFQIEQLTPKDEEPGEPKKVCAVLPFFHITGLVHVLHLPIYLNAHVYMLPSFTMETMLDAITEYKIKELLLVPPIVIRMVRDPIVDKYDLSHITRFSSGAAPLSEEILVQLKDKFPQTGFKQGYGMTESCSCISAHPADKFDYKYAHTGGTIVASTEVKILGEQGNELGYNQPGEVYARGPQITMGYLNNKKATEETFLPGGWLRTGDQAMVDEEGFITVTDRLKEMVKVKGIAVAPAELEDLLLGHPNVEDCAVMSVPDEYSGEKPKAYVVAKGMPQSEELGRALLAYVKEKKVRYKWVKEVEFIAEIPKSPSGKILRRVLKDRMKAGQFGLVVRDVQEDRAKL